MESVYEISGNKYQSIVKLNKVENVEEYLLLFIHLLLFSKSKVTVYIDCDNLLLKHILRKKS